MAVLPLDFVKIRWQGMETMTTKRIIWHALRTEGAFALRNEVYYTVDAHSLSHLSLGQIVRF